MGRLSTGTWIDPGSNFKIRATAVGVPDQFETVYSIYGSDGKLLSEYNETGTCMKDYLYLGGKLLAEFQPVTNRYYYYTSDQINSTRIVTDSSGSLVYSRQYDPYGGVLSTESKVYVPKMGFSGKERESVSELDYFGARYYDHKTYRFNSVDPVINKEDAISSPQRWNLYAFCVNNPITLFDPDGRDVSFLIGGPYNGNNYGHTALRVFGSGYDFTYDFGRYGAKWGRFNSEGEGVLRVWNNFNRYMSGENATGRETSTYTFGTSLEQDKVIMQFYSNLIGNSSPTMKTKTMSQYRLSQDYHWGENNCTTLSIKAFTSGTNIDVPNDTTGRGMNFIEKFLANRSGWPSKTFMPFDLKNSLESMKK